MSKQKWAKGHRILSLVRFAMSMEENRSFYFHDKFIHHSFARNWNLQFIMYQIMRGALFEAVPIVKP